jgi:hypothetical protein
LCTVGVWTNIRNQQTLANMTSVQNTCGSERNLNLRTQVGGICFSLERLRVALILFPSNYVTGMIEEQNRPIGHLDTPDVHLC